MRDIKPGLTLVCLLAFSYQTRIFADISERTPSLRGSTDIHMSPSPQNPEMAAAAPSLQANETSTVPPSPRYRSYWPTGGWEYEEGGEMPTEACGEFRRVLVDDAKKRKAGNARSEDDPLETDSLLVIRKGKIAFEYYDGVNNKNTKHPLWSASKSISSAILGTAIEQGKVSLDDPLEKFFPYSQRTAPAGPNDHFYSLIKISDLAWMGSGFDWRELYDGDPRNSSITQMLYQGGASDTAKFAANQPLLPEGPMGRWNYSSGNISMIMAALKQAYGTEYQKMPWKNLFDPIGMKNVVIEKDAAGTFLGSSYIYTTTQDFAKFAFLYLNDGLWEDSTSPGKLRRIIPREMIDRARELSPAVEAPGTPADYIKEEGVYGGTFWLNKPVPSKGVPKPFPDAPDDMFFAAGHYGQLALILPSEDLILVRTGHDAEYWSKINKITKLLRDCFAPTNAKARP